MDSRAEDPEVLEARAAALAEPRASTGAVVECLVVRAGSRRLAVPTGRAVQVVPPGPLAPLPPGETALTGIRATSGGLVAAAPLADMVGERGSAPAEEQWIVVLDGQPPLGVLVDSVEGVAALPLAHHAGPAGRGVVAGPLPGGADLVDVDTLLAQPRLWWSPPGAPPRRQGAQ